MAMTKSKNNGRNNPSLKQIVKYAGKNLDMVPYAGAAVKGASFLYDNYDSIKSLMSHFTSSRNPAAAGGPASLTAGVSNAVQIRRSAPKFVHAQGSVRIVHKELIGDIKSSDTVSVSPQFESGASVFTVNAANGNAFPWLSQIAANYDRYRFKRLRIVYVPLCATTERGRISLLYDVDSQDAMPRERQALSSYNCSSEGAPWATQYLDCKLTDTNKWYFTRSAGPTETLPQSGALVDQGQFFSASYSGEGTAAVGEIYALYDVELTDPQPSNTSMYQAFGVGVDVKHKFAATAPAFYVSGSTINVVRISFTSPGKYFVSLNCSTTSAGTVSIDDTDTGTIDGERRVTNGTRTITNTFITVRTIPCLLKFEALTALSAWTVYLNRAPILDNTFIV